MACFFNCSVLKLCGLLVATRGSASTDSKQMIDGYGLIGRLRLLHAAASVPICAPSLACVRVEGYQRCLKRVPQPQEASDAAEDAFSFHVLQ